MEDDEKTVNEQVYSEIDEPTQQEEVVTEPEVTEEETQEENEGNTNTAKERIRELAAQKNVAEAERSVKDAQLRSLQDRIQEAGNYDPTQETPWYQPPSVNPGEEVSPEQYQQHVLQTADALVELKLRARDNAGRLKAELVEAVTQYKELDPRATDSFDPDLNEAVVGAVDAYVKANPTGNVKKYIDSLMKPYHKSVERRVGEQQQKVVKQVSETAIRPTHQSGAGEKAFKDLSLEEMEAKLGKVHG